MFGISSDRVPVDESKSTLPTVSVKTDLDAVAVGLVWNFRSRRGTKLELQLESLAIDPRRLVRQQIGYPD